MNLDQLFKINTPESIKEQYKKYPDEAQNISFGLLQNYVVVDCETTGLDFKNDELIEVAGAKVEAGQVVDTFQSFVLPSKEIPEYISKLTNIYPEDVQNAPNAHTVCSQLKTFVDGLPVVAHNATFDKVFLENSLYSKGLSDTWIDSLMLARIALPHLKSYGLQTLSQAFGCVQSTHRALDDVLALCEIYKIILVGLLYLPSGLPKFLSEMHPKISWCYRDVFKQIAQMQAEEPFDFLSYRKRFAQQSLTKKDNPIDSVESLKPISKQVIKEAFLPNGYADQMYSNFKYRHDQVLLAQEVRSAQESLTHRVLEAGTGVGKTLGYLLPSVLYAKQNNVGIGVATKTNALTDQLIEHEIPLLKQVFKGDLSYIALKGYTHYVCLRKLEQACTSKSLEVFVDTQTKSKHTVETDILNALAVLCVHACYFAYDDIDSLGIKWNNVRRDLVCTTALECKKNKCKYYNGGCFVQGARRAAQACDVVVTNHSLLLRDVEAEGSILPPIKHWIIDEAHSFEEQARKQWSIHVGCSQITFQILSVIGDEKRKGYIEQIRKKASKYDTKTLIYALCSQVLSLGSEIVEHLESFKTVLEQFVLKQASNMNYGTVVVWVSEGARNTHEWESVLNYGSELHNLLNIFYNRLIALHNQLNPSENTKKTDESLTTAIRELGCAVTSLDELINTYSQDFVYSIELTQRYNKVQNIELKAEFVNIGKSLASRWLEEMLSVVFTSATIEVGEKFDYFSKQIGLSELPNDMYLGKKLQSCFNYRENMLSLLVGDLPEQRDRSYFDDVSRALVDIHCAMNGATLTLFTNKRDMEECYERVQPALEKMGIKLYKQSSANTARAAKDNFLANTTNSLFALKSFWEGFDAQGETLSCVVIVKLPFMNPKEPLLQEMDARGEKVWYSHMIPDAVIALKQAVGRLLRNEEDSGVVVILDSRMERMSYGRLFKGALPVRPQTISKAMLKSVISDWKVKRG